MPPSTMAEREAALVVLRELNAELDRATGALRSRRAEHVSRMVNVLGMSRREIGEAVGVSHNAIRIWLAEKES